MGNLHLNIRRFHHELELIQLEPVTEQNCILKNSLRTALLEEQRKDESLWRSKSRVHWLTSKELNTRFFHISTIVRRRRNAIEFLKHPSGSWLDSREEIGKLFVASFTELYSSNNPRPPGDLDGLISPIISAQENLELCHIPSETEVWATVRQIGARKAPGPDGLSALFYKQFWPTVKTAVCSDRDGPKCVSDGFSFERD